MYIDFHCDTLMDVADGKRRLINRGEGHLDLPRLKEAGALMQVFACFVEDVYVKKEAVNRTLAMIDSFYNEVDDSNGQLRPVFSYEDMEYIKNTDEVGGLLSIEGGEALEGSLYILRSFYRLGVRAITLTWSRRNELGDGIGEDSGSGLTSFGKSVVREMDRLGMIVDVSHLNEKGFWDVIDISSAPVIASHSDCKGLCAHRRNLTDEQIKAIASTGGVIGINFAAEFLSSGQAGMEDIIRHIDHIVDVAGIDYVGFGSDFDGCTIPEDMNGVSDMPVINQKLLNKGYSPEDIEKISYKNWERVIKKVLG
ncbi:MAG: dipeptidase [Thermoanaerobacteraceae bacterium]|nr:dipeptidase [Thermoanaerobacteraceae bacterium]